MVTRYVRALVFCQTIRMVSFLVTVLPSPNFHCRSESPDYDPPQNAAEIFLRLDLFTGCGDLIPSSHAIFTTLGGLLINHYSKNMYLKGVVAMLVLALGFLVVAARKHYSIDVVSAWYICPLVWFYCSKTFPDEVPKEEITTAAASTSNASNEDAVLDSEQNSVSSALGMA
jgi:membrane-associated phospholipid phosphatase